MCRRVWLWRLLRWCLRCASIWAVSCSMPVFIAIKARSWCGSVTCPVLVLSPVGIALCRTLCPRRGWRRDGLALLSLPFQISYSLLENGVPRFEGLALGLQLFVLSIPYRGFVTVVDGHSWCLILRVTLLGPATSVQSPLRWTAVTGVLRFALALYKSNILRLRCLLVSR